jgi:hypothetical protein
MSDGSVGQPLLSNPYTVDERVLDGSAILSITSTENRQYGVSGLIEDQEEVSFNHIIVCCREHPFRASD